ncbi:MAG TPA: hypothetical protein VE177_05085, partial [Candidatus Binatus sp.]|nr:hypothetical protein [Candidatus Binatus sp.]
LLELRHMLSDRALHQLVRLRRRDHLLKIREDNVTMIVNQRQLSSQSYSPRRLDLILVPAINL